MAHRKTADQILIAGGGIAGLSTALALHKLGLKNLTVLEQANSLRVTGASLTIWDNGWKALDAIGVGDILRRKHTKLQSIETLSASSGLSKILDISGHEVRGVKRKELLEVLAGALPRQMIEFGSKISAIHETRKGDVNNSVTVELENGRCFSPKVVIGCDGVNSAVAKWLGLGTPNLAGRSAFLGLATYPHGHQFSPKTVQIWGNGVRAGFYPCNQNEVFWFLIRYTNPQDAEIYHNEESLLEQALSLADNLNLPNEDLTDVINRTVPETLNLAVLRYRFFWPFLAKRAVRANVTVAGDAMHPMTPDLGQGGALALEDSVILARCLAEGGSDGVDVALQKYVEKRTWRAFGMGVGSYVSGVVQTGGFWLPKLVRDKVLFEKISPKMMRHTEYDCGSL